jgi:hypothetical protein
MARKPYRNARQEHLADALDDLQRRGVLEWRWDYADRRAIYWIGHDVKSQQRLDTRGAEILAERHLAALGERWFPVPFPGGERQREETLARLAAAEKD